MVIDKFAICCFLARISTLPHATSRRWIFDELLAEFATDKAEFGKSTRNEPDEPGTGSRRLANRRFSMYLVAYHRLVAPRWVQRRGNCFSQGARRPPRPGALL